MSKCICSEQPIIVKQIYIIFSLSFGERKYCDRRRTNHCVQLALAVGFLVYWPMLDVHHHLGEGNVIHAKYYLYNFMWRVSSLEKCFIKTFIRVRISFYHVGSTEWEEICYQILISIFVHLCWLVESSRWQILTGWVQSEADRGEVVRRRSSINWGIYLLDGEKSLNKPKQRREGRL